MDATQTLSSPPPLSTSFQDRSIHSADRASASDSIRSKALIETFAGVRRQTETLTEPLTPEDHVIQAMPEASPPKWHLAHSSWFFERFVLRDHVPAYEPRHPHYEYLFNSYYNSVGPMHCRPKRGLVSRPTVEEVFAYRREIDGWIEWVIDACAAGSEVPNGNKPWPAWSDLERLITLGVHHEQQHQELLLSDVKYNFSANPILPAYREPEPSTLVSQSQASKTKATQSQPSSDRRTWRYFEGGIREIGAETDHGFCYDHETPRHQVLLQPFYLADRLVTNGEYLAFMEAGGYDRHELWLSLAWDTVRAEGWQAPLYWYREAGENEGRWLQYTLAGPAPVEMDEPVSHLSYFEADAFARWAGARLPNEAEWEVAATEAGAEYIDGNFAEDRRLHPQPVSADTPPADKGPASVRVSAVNGHHGSSTSNGKSVAPPRLHQMFGDLWEWTRSAYGPYPGYQQTAGALGEYNGKFMCNQYVLRGGSTATPRSHARLTYRNFFPPDARWQFTGLRLAYDG